VEKTGYLVISDVDGTLLGDDAALAEFADWLRPRRDRFRLVYNSGRFSGSVSESIRQMNMPEPDAIIGGVGTEIRRFPSGEPIGNWLQNHHGWDPPTIRAVLDRYEQLELQPEEFLSEYKLSYYGYDLDREFLQRLKQALQEAGCDVELVYSSQRDLDVLPRGADKGTAAAFLARDWSFSPKQTIVSGDSGNDLPMFQQEFRGIVVKNAHPELRLLDSPRVYQAGRSYAGGVLEGLQHWVGGVQSPAVDSMPSGARS